MKRLSITETEFNAKFDDAFWATLSLVNKQFKNDAFSFNGFDMEPTEKDFRNLHASLGDETFMAFIDKINVCKDLIDKETNLRIDLGMESFADDNCAGGDDSHFMDMPYHLIAKGKAAVMDYLFNDGCFVGYAIESFCYGFQSIVMEIEDKNAS